MSVAPFFDDAGGFAVPIEAVVGTCHLEQGVNVFASALLRCGHGSWFPTEFAARLIAEPSCIAYVIQLNAEQIGD